MTRPSRWIVLASVGALAALTAVAAVAQDNAGGGPGGGSRRGRFGGGMMGGGMMGGGTMDPRLSLLRNETVQKELELVDDQKEKLKGLGDEMRKVFQDSFTGLRDLSPEERQKKFAEIQEQMKPKVEAIAKKLDDILLPHQADRLQQLAVQARGATALLDPKVQEQLGIDADQKAKIQAMREKYAAKMRELMPQGGGGGQPPANDADREARRAQFQEARNKMDAMQKEASDEVLALLTPSQKESFEKMQGKKFDFGPNGAFGGFGGGRGGRGAPGGGKPAPKQ